LSSMLRLPAYALVAILALFQLYVLWLVAHPDVPPDYNAYYIARTTTCLNQPVTGRYGGGLVSFQPDGAALAKPVKVCGWEGPAGDGTHAVGTSSRLRFVADRPITDPNLHIELVAVKKGDRPTAQRVGVSLNDTELAELSVGAEQSQTFTIPIPARLVANADGRYELTLTFPDAVAMGPTDPDTRWRSIKLLAAGILPGS
jgi:hypothetical protein